MAAELLLRSRTTATLQADHLDEGEVLDRLLPLVYDELRAMAHRHLGRERALKAPHTRTLNTTALVHEAYLKLVDQTRVTARGRAYFFAAAARAMRQVLVDHARRRKSAKRGGGKAVLPLEDVEIAVDAFAAELLDLDRALDGLAALNPRHVRVVECRFFGGLSVEETAAALGTSERTVKNDWALARAWLHRALQPPQDGGGG